jgi:hypothetical protein
VIGTDCALNLVEMPMEARYRPPQGKHRNGHQRPMTDREKRKAAEERRKRLLATEAPAEAPKAEPAKCGFRWRNAKGARRWCCLPAHGPDVDHLDRKSGARVSHLEPSPSADGAGLVEAPAA